MILLITDPAWPLEHIEHVIAEAARGTSKLIVQLRHKDASTHELRAAAHRLRELTRRVGARFVVNGAIDVALEVRADGVHVPCSVFSIADAKRAMRWVSTPTHDDDEVSIAARAGATAVLVSPIYETPGKGLPRGVEALRSARSRYSGQIFALGGIDPSRVEACKQAGADGVAVIRALLDAPDPEAEARALDGPFFGV